MKHPMLKYLREDAPSGPRLPMILCPGCGAGQVLNYTLQAVDSVIREDGVAKDDFVFISGIGCSSRVASQYLNFDSAWTLHGRALAVATGAILANPDLRVVVFTGDGDAAAIGGNHLIHACRRNLNVTVICMNNAIYGMTGGQVAPTTPLERVTASTPYGNVEPSFDLCALAEAAGAPFVARWTTAHPVQTVKTIAKGIRKKGTAFIEILSQCPVHEKKSATRMFREWKDKTVRRRDADVPGNEGKAVIGEFLNVDRPDWTARYQAVMDRVASGGDENE